MAFHAEIDSQIVLVVVPPYCWNFVILMVKEVIFHWEFDWLQDIVVSCQGMQHIYVKMNEKQECWKRKMLNQRKRVCSFNPPLSQFINLNTIPVHHQKLVTDLILNIV